jgi:hypothetical protein
MVIYASTSPPLAYDDDDDNNNNNNNNNHNHISVMELGHLLTHSGLTYPEVSSKEHMIRALKYPFMQTL